MVVDTGWRCQRKRTISLFPLEILISSSSIYIYIYIYIYVSLIYLSIGRLCWMGARSRSQQSLYILNLVFVLWYEQSGRCFTDGCLKYLLKHVFSLLLRDQSTIRCQHWFRWWSSNRRQSIIGAYDGLVYRCICSTRPQWLISIAPCIVWWLFYTYCSNVQGYVWIYVFKWLATLRGRYSINGTCSKR